jgi:hypothetical protein
VAAQTAIEWFAESAQPFVLLGVIISVVWNVAISYTQLKHIRKNMVTKENLVASQLKLMSDLKDWANERFVTSRECATRVTTLHKTGNPNPRGGQHG